jgi:hypothetical protein
MSKRTVPSRSSLASKVGRRPLNPVRLLYAGNFGTKQGLLDFCKVLQAHPLRFDFRIHGEGALAARVREWVHSCADPRFSFGPLLDEARFVQALHETDLFVITERSGSGASFFPSKATAGMTTGTPTLAISDPHSPLGREMRAHNLGPWFSWESCPAATELLASLQGRAAEFAAWQHNALRRSRYYDRDRCLDLVESVLHEMVLDPTLAGTRAAATADLWATLGPMNLASQPASHTLSS